MDTNAFIKVVIMMGLCSDSYTIYHRLSNKKLNATFGLLLFKLLVSEVP